MIKRFRGSSKHARHNFKIESSILQKLANRRALHKNIMFSLCSYRYGSTDAPEFYIVFPSAECSLATYLENNQNAKNGLKNILQMMHIADALNWLCTGVHHHEPTSQFRTVRYYHCDLTPDNILLTEDLNSGKGNFIFKIGDFGRALEWVMPDRDDAQEEVDTPKVDRITGKYAAPELDDEKPNVSEKSDVWSFGCILLYVLIFHYGDSGLTQFDADLLHKSNRDSFFYKKGRGASLKKEVTNNINNLHKTKGSDKFVVKDLLELLKNSVLKTKPNSRIGIKEVHARMEEAYRKKDYITPDIEERKVKSVGFRHCAQSPQGEFEVFHGSQDNYSLFVWRFGQPGPFTIHIPPPSLSYTRATRLYPHSQACGSSTICQVRSNQSPFEVFPSFLPINLVRTSSLVLVCHLPNT